MAAALDPGAFDEDDPQAFYMLDDGRADMEATADATLVVQGKRLRAHSQVVKVLSLQSRVLRGLFANLLGSSRNSDASSQEGACTHDAHCGRKRKAAEIEEPVIEAPFQDCTLFKACLFLRFCYQPRDLTPANLAAVLGSLPGLLRLAHKLDAPQIQQAVCAYVADKVHSATQSVLLEWVAAADHCQLPELRLACLSQLARRMASEPSHVSSMAADSALLTDACRDGMLTQAALVELVAVQADMMRRANPGSFEWALERYSEQPSAVGQYVESPWFSAAGKEWRFRIYPGGDVEQAAGHLSAYMNCKEGGTRAKHTITLVDQAAEGRQHVAKTTGVKPDLFGDASQSWGWLKFATHEQLRSRPGYLAGDRLVLRASVEVVL